MIFASLNNKNPYMFFGIFILSLLFIFSVQAASYQEITAIMDRNDFNEKASIAFDRCEYQNDYSTRNCIHHELKKELIKIGVNPNDLQIVIVPSEELLICGKPKNWQISFEANPTAQTRNENRGSRRRR